MFIGWVEVGGKSTGTLLVLCRGGSTYLTVCRTDCRLLCKLLLVFGLCSGAAASSSGIYLPDSIWVWSWYSPSSCSVSFWSVSLLRVWLDVHRSADSCSETFGLANWLYVFDISHFLFLCRYGSSNLFASCSALMFDVIASILATLCAFLRFFTRLETRSCSFGFD